MATYYFNPAIGSDSNDGLSASSPKRTPSGSVVSGANDIGLIARGTEWTAPAGTQAINIGANGITWGAYGDGDNPPKIVATQVSRGVNIGTNIAGATIRDIWIDNVASGTSRRGITNAVTGSSETVPVSILIENVTITNVITDGANDCNGMNIFGEDVKIVGCVVDGVATDGIWVRSRKCEIARTKVRNVAQDDAVRGAFGDCIQFGGAGASDFTGGYVHDCELDHTSSVNVKNAFIVNAASGTTDFRFLRNVVKASTVINQVAVYIDLPVAKVQANEVHGGDYGIFMGNAAGQRVAGNVVIGANSGIRLGGSTTGSVIANNTLMACAYGFYATANDAGTVIRNNVLSRCGVGLFRHGNMSEDYNVFDRNDLDAQYSNGSGSIGAASQVLNLSAYIDGVGGLRIPAGTTLATLGEANPAAAAGVFVAGVLMRNGRLRPGITPAGAYLPVIDR